MMGQLLKYSSEIGQRSKVKDQGQILKFICLRDNSKLDEAAFTKLGPRMMYDGTIS